jgi:hypothetical protein
MGHMLCFWPMGFRVSPATVLRGGEDRLSYRLQLRFKKCNSEGDYTNRHWQWPNVPCV